MADSHDHKEKTSVKSVRGGLLSAMCTFSGVHPINVETHREETVSRLERVPSVQ